jgi:putative mRNA 3-end processing factor
VRRRRGFDRGFVVSDHADFPGLMQAIEATGATRVLATHGFVDPLVRLLRDRGLDAAPLATMFTGEGEADEPSAGDDESREETADEGDDA